MKKIKDILKLLEIFCGNILAFIFLSLLKEPCNYSVEKWYKYSIGNIKKIRIHVYDFLILDFSILTHIKSKV